MKRLQVTFELRSPTCIAQRPTAPGQLTETTSYLKGTVIRGGVATHWLAGQRYADLSDERQARFTHLFLNGAITFGNAWPIVLDEWQTEIVPKTAWTDKRAGGWREDNQSGVYDILAWLLRLGTQDDPETADRLAQLDRVSDEFARTHQRRWARLHIRRRLISRTALTPMERGLPSVARGVADEGQLYSFEALEAGQYFRAMITGPSELLDELASGYLRKETILTLGQGRSRGLGQVRVHAISRAPDMPRSLDDLIRMSKTFSLRAGVRDGYAYLPVTLESDVILRDHYLLPCSSGDVYETLNRYTRDPCLPLELYDAIQSTRWVSGWDELRRIPRPLQLAVQQGSVWVYRVPIDHLEQAITWWLEIEKQGIGERRSEGFGRIRLLHPLHAEERKGGW